MYFILFVSAIFCCAQCIPLDASHTESSSSSQLHLITKDSTSETSYHSSPVMRILEDMDKEIEDQLKAILPYLTFFFDPLLAQSQSADDDEDDEDDGGVDCISQVVIEMVPDETAIPATPQPNEKVDKTPEEPNPDTANTVGKPEDIAKDNPNVVATLEKPVNNSQSSD